MSNPRFLTLSTVIAAIAAAGASFAPTAQAQEIVPPPFEDRPAATGSDEGRSPSGVSSYGESFFAPLKPATALDMIKRLPGFSLDQGNTDVRGFAGSGGNVLINGARPNTKSEGLEDLLRRLSARTVERIEVISGGAQGIDMQGRAVIANIILRQDASTETVVNANVYLYPDGFLGPLISVETTRGQGSRKLEGAILVTRDRTDQTYDGGKRVRVEPDGTLGAHAALKGNDLIKQVNLKGAVDDEGFGGSYRLNGQFNWFAFDRTVNNHRLVPDPSFDQNLEGYSERKLELGLQYDRRLASGRELRWLMLQNSALVRYASRFESPDQSQIFRDLSDTSESILRVQLSDNRTAGASWEAGGEAAFNLLDERTSFVEDGVPVDLPAANVRVEELRGELFGKTTFDLRPALKFEAGTRVEFSRISQSGDTELAKEFVFPKPRLVLTWQASERDRMQARFEQEVSQLNFSDFVSSAGLETATVDAGNPDLKPSRTLVSELSYERKFGRNGVLTLTYAHGEIRDVVDAIPVLGSFDAPGNIGRGTSDTFRMAVTSRLDGWRVPGGQMRLTANWRDSAVKDPVTGETRRISGQVPFNCSVSFNQDVPGGKWSWGASYNCANFSESWRINEVRRNENFPWMETFVEWKARKDLVVTAQFANLLAKEAVRRRWVHAGPRSTAPLDFQDIRSVPFEPYLYLQIRKTL